MLLDGARLQVADLEGAHHDYSLLLGFEGTQLDTGVFRFQLEHGAIELAQGGDTHALRFAASSEAASEANIHGLRVIVQPDPATPLHAGADAITAIDHVVVHTPSPERAIATWRDQHGLRLALDREFPQRHLRLQFFRSNKITLEYASPLPAPAETGDDRFFGISYRTASLERTRSRLIAADVDVSEIRTGMRSGTRVATVRSHTHGVATLLLEVLTVEVA